MLRVSPAAWLQPGHVRPGWVTNILALELRIMHAIWDRGARRIRARQGLPIVRRIADAPGPGGRDTQQQMLHSERQRLILREQS